VTATRLSAFNESISALVNAPLKFLPAALREVPAVKYALAVLAVAGCVAVAMSYFASPQSALAALIVGLILMGVMVVFAKAASADGKHTLAAAIFIWFCLLLFIVWAAGMTTSAFGGWPIELSILDGANEKASSPPAKPQQASVHGSVQDAGIAPSEPAADNPIDAAPLAPRVPLEITNLRSTSNGSLDVTFRNRNAFPINITRVDAVIEAPLGASPLPVIKPERVRCTLEFSRVQVGAVAGCDLNLDVPSNKLTRILIRLRMKSAAKVKFTFSYDAGQSVSEVEKITF
jgi:hypothetical protein